MVVMGHIVPCGILKMKDHTLLLPLIVYFVMFVVLYLEFIPCGTWECTMPW